MSDFVANIAARSLGTARVIRPRALPTFAEQDAPGIREAETSFELDYLAPDISRQRSPAREAPQHDRFETLNRPSPEEPASATSAEPPARRLHSDAVSPAHRPATKSEPEDPVAGPMQPRAGNRPSLEPTISPVQEIAFGDRTSAATPPAIFEQSTPAAKQPPHLPSPAPRVSRISPPSPAAQTRDQPPSPVPRPDTPIPSHSVALPDPAIPAPSSLALSARRHAPDLASVFTEEESNIPALRPGRSAPFAMDAGRRARSLQSLRQSISDATAGPGELDVHITIGRVDVRATLASPAQEKKERNTSSLQLADYLKRRDGSGAR